MKDWHNGVASWLYWLLTNKVVLLSVGGAAGTNARYWLGVLLKDFALRKELPFLATMVINVTGSLVLGVFTGLFGARLRPEHDAL